MLFNFNIKKYFLVAIATVLIFATTCKKEEMQAPPQGLNQKPVFSYDNTSVEGVFDAADFKYDNAKLQDQVIPHTGYYLGENNDGSYNCALGPLCWVEVRAKKNEEQKDLVFLVAPEKPIVKEGQIKIISEENGYTVFTIN